jgi:Glucodextranase, domain B
MNRISFTLVRVVASLSLVFGLFAFVPDSPASDFFLHSTTNDFLDNASPTATTAKFKDSAAVNRTTYQEIGTWAAAPTATWTRLTSLSDLHIWIGLKNSDDQGTNFDLRAELRKNGVVIASGETKNIQGVTRNPDQAKEVTVGFGPISGDQFNPGDVVSIKILTKVADAGGHNSAVGLRLYYDAVSRASRFGAVFVVDTTPPTIAAVVNPAANAAGWHMSNPTVSFTCSDSESGIASCPGPITVSTEGANQIITGTATDKAGNSASANVFISLDKTVPVLTIASPSNGTSVSSSPVKVTGTASDSLSGIATVLCNGNPASLSNSTFSCDVPLNNGPNTITAEAIDVAGNTGSLSISVTRETQDVPTFRVAANSQNDLRGENWGDQIVFWWSYHAGAIEYIIYRAPSSSGPWEELGRMSDAVARTSGPKIDDTPDARLIDLCYKVEAIDTVGQVLRFYDPMCVPKFLQ